MPFYARPTDQDYVAECFRLLHVVQEEPKWCLLLVGFFATSDGGAVDPQSCPYFRKWEKHNTTYYTARQIWTSEGSKVKTRHTAQRCAF